MTQTAVTEPTGTPPSAGVKHRGVGDRSLTFDVIAHVLLILWSLLVVLPLLWVFVSSFKTTQEVLGSPLTLPHHLNLNNYATAWNDSGVGPAFINSVIVVGFSLVIVMVLGAMCSYVLARFRFFGNRFIYYLMLAGLTFPVFLAIVPLFSILKNFGLLNTLAGLVVTYVAFALPFTVFFLHAFFKRLPYDVYEAAQVDGAGEWRTFFQVMLPMARPGLASVAIFNFLGLWNQFLLPTVLKPDNSVLTQAMAQFQSQAGYAVDFGALFAAVVITVAPVLVVYIIFQRQLRGSVVAGAVK
ncbi:carbohydrate ABC transporter permease [Actinocatenispora rupis]|uniref:Sugar ABC transporter permease n=1 Tax=Actinocatenispora rupis TaxID=519421 RepID=A0A8J3J1W8_9ACTN|nr:carbohydrate ABC transporter permease [Actinocatenispora rupis]GID13020.1 sugar ABC transporter permease [Actinocatenispora rupis]